MYIKSWRTWIFIIYVYIILYVSLQTPGTLHWLRNLWKYDKLIHFVEYLILGFLLIKALKIKPIEKYQWNYAILFLFIFPVIDETLQYFTPRRIPDILDGIADISGGIIGAYLRRYI